MAGRYDSDISDEGIVEELTLDCLPFDCIVLVCQFLPPNDLARFSRVCKFFHEASLIGSLWRQHSLVRWVFCDIHQISEGPNRWRRYYSARRKVEARQEQGRPGRDYKVKTLRGHETDIQSVGVVGGGSVNWKKPKPPLVISLSSDGNVKAWDVLQAKPVWSLEGQGVASMAASEQLLEVATGGADGSIAVWDCEEWREKGRLVSHVGNATQLQYGRAKSDRLPGTFLIASIAGGVGSSGQVELWDTKHLSTVAESADEAQAAPPSKPFLELWAPSQTQRLLLSSQGLLAIEAGFGEIHVWDLPTLTESTDPPPHHPHVTLHTPNHVASSCWEGGGCLATRSLGGVNIDLWDVGSHLCALKKAGRSLYDNRNIYNPVRSIPCSSMPVVITRFHALPVVPTTALCCARGLLMVGGQEGELTVVNTKTGEEVQKFRDHKGAITDIYADHYRVLTCSKDFSIRVYRWLEGKAKEDLPQLESRYTLLGGSVAHKTHDGFQQLVCEAGSCVGVCGPQLKFYTFTCKLD